ncbi:MAG TPA: histidine kinase dimerization/phosphoacceptor domain -containing protein [Saprospiraceae bacterium]|nr:histidine kinase dimerization/phosphoacceptor domain -containing protein [Saprospiraceae bacterium]
MFRKPILVFATVLFSWGMQAQPSAVDSLSALLPSLPDGAQKIEVLNQLLKLYLNSDLEKSLQYAHQVAGLSKKTGNRLALATVYKDLGVIHLIGSAYDSSQYYSRLGLREYDVLLTKSSGEELEKVREGYAGTISNLGNWHYYQSALDSAVVYHRQAVELGRKWGADKPAANSLSTLAYIYLDQSQYEQAIEMHLEALRIFEKLDNQDGISRSWQGIGEINCEYLNKCKTALDYFRKALKIKQKTGSERGMGYVFRLIGGAYDKLEMIDSAYFYYQKTIATAEKLNDKRLLIDGYSAIVSIAEAVGMPEQEQLEINLKYIALAEEIGREDGLFVGYSNLGNMYRNKGAYDKAVEYYQKAALSAESQKNYGFLEKLYLKQYEIFKTKLRDESKALAALEAYLVNHDSVSNAAKFQAVEDISTRYETEKKEALIAEQQEAMHRDRIRFRVITGILVVAVLIGALLLGLTRQLRKRNREKEFLIKEIHHRVKNNLQVLSSLLHLQSRHIQDEAALDAVREGQNRVDAMSLIHQKLYMGDNLAAVDMRDYLHNLGDTLLDAFGLEDDRVRIVCHVEALRLDVDTAIPLGLIVNELVTNSLKYAFPGGRQGVVEISLWKNEADKLCLKVADDGVGQADAPALKNSTSFGTGLVEILSKKLKGKAQVLHENGYATLIEMEQFRLG